MENEKISIIVPVYKTEIYLRKCIESILAQTYTNLEIILVDDGSPDKCGEICDEFKEKDDRIKVIHKSNGGVSSARNAGLSMVSGEWIGWVDSDDVIEPDMFEQLYNNAMENSADISVCSRIECYKNKQVFRGWDKLQVLDTNEALGLLFENDRMQNFLWDKLWRKELFEDVVFPEGRTYEDIAIMHRLFLRAKSVVVIPQALYYYVQHEGSIVADTTLKNRINHFIAAKQRYEELKDTQPQYCDLLESQCVASAVGIWTTCLKNPKEERRHYRVQIKEIARFSKKHYKNALKYMNLGLTGRAVMRLTPYANIFSFVLGRVISLIYKIKHGKEL